MSNEKELEYLGRGDVEGFLKNMADSANPEIVANVRKSVEHLSDKSQYQKLYGYGPSVEFVRTEVSKGVEEGRVGLDQRQRMVLQIMSQHKRGSHLDLASSDGLLLLEARRMGLSSIGVGIELCSGRVAKAEANRRALQVSDVVFLNGMVEDVPLYGSFDIVTAGEVLEHVMDPVVFLRRAEGFLSATGILITTVPVGRPPLHEWEKKIELSSSPREHVRFLNRETLGELAWSVGLDLVQHYEQRAGWDNLISVWKKS